LVRLRTVELVWVGLAHGRRAIAVKASAEDRGIVRIIILPVAARLLGARRSVAVASD